MYKIKNILFPACLFMCALVIYTPISNSAELHKKEFSMLLPDDWVEMPVKAIRDYLRDLAEAAPDVPLQNYDYGFQSGDAAEWFEYPYILIQINNKGRIPERQLEKLEEIPVQENIDKHREALKAILSDVEMGKMFYDKKARIIWMRVELDVINSGKVSGILGMIPTEKGFINVIGYSEKEVYTDYEALFQTIAMSVKPSPELLYRIRNWEKVTAYISHTRRHEITGMAITGCIIGGIILLAVLTARKKRKQEDGSVRRFGSD